MAVLKFSAWTPTQIVLFYLANTMYASKNAKFRPTKNQLRIATDLMEIVMTIVVAASTQLSGQLSL